MFSRISTLLIVCIMLIGLVGVLQTTAITADEMLAAHEAAHVALNAHDLDQCLTYWADNAVYEFEPTHAPAEGKEAIRAFFESLFVGFPDFQVDKGRIMAGENVLIVEHSTTGTQMGEWMGIPPTGVTTEPLPHIDIEEYDESGKLKRVTTYFDMVSLLVQLGQMPAPELPDLMPSFTPPDPEPTGLAPLEANAELVARWSPQNLGNWIKMVHPDAVFRYNTVGMVPLNREQTLALNELFALSNSTLHGEVVRQFDLGDGWVASESVWSGVQDGPYFGIPASGNPVEVHAAGAAHYDADGLVTELNFYFDNLSVLTQIGAFPPLPPLPEYPPIPDYLVQDKITSPSLEGNLLGDPATRDVLVYLPPSYETSSDKRYPTVYLLHGYTGDHRLFVFTANVAIQSLTGIDLGVDIGDIVNSLMATGDLGEVIIVLPDAKNVYGGSWYERSDVLGDYRNYIARDLVEYIDSKYRTIPDREHRAIAGHSMGGYGALSLAIEYPDVFGAVAALSPGAPDVEAPPTVIDMFIAENPDKLGEPIMISTDDDMWRMFLTNFWTNIMYSAAATYSPNPDNPPYYVDLPIQYPEKTIVEDVWSKWKERDLVSQIEQNGANLSDTAIFIDKGVGETVVMEEVSGVERIPVALDAQGIPYTYDEFDGDHLTHLRYQLASALKFLSPHIGAFPPPPDKEAIRELARRGFEDIWNQKNLGAIDELVTPDLVQHQPAGIGDMVGTTAFKQFAASYIIAFPDINFELHDIIVEGDLAAIRWTGHGSHQGPFMGVPPSGREGAGTTGITITRFENGKQVESWNEWDALGLMGWLGLIPTEHEQFQWGEPVPITGDPGDPEQNKAVVMRFVEEVFNQKKLDVIDETHHPDAIAHDPNVSPMEDVALMKQIIGAYLVAFPDFHATKQALIAEGDMVVGRWTVTTTHQGDFFGIPPTGKRAQWTAMNIFRFADGKIAESWWAYDALGLLQQLGAVPTGPPEDFSKVFFLSLKSGLNMVSLPLKSITPYTARSFAEELSATVVIKLDETRQRFVGFTLDAPDDGFPIEGGKGYIVNVPKGRVVAFTGAAWTNQPPVESAAPILAQSDGAWAFVVSGRFFDDLDDSLRMDGYLVTVRNTRTNAVATDVVRKGYFAAAFADLNRKNVVQTGDILELQVRNQAGEIISETLSYTVTADAIRQALLPLALKNIEIPRQSLLLQNYPNPFNPETWIPYQIREPADVVIRIYNANGQLVRMLDLGRRSAGFYLGHTRAAYWDGRNERGERVGSGVYFYHISAGDFSSTRRMLIVK